VVGLVAGFLVTEPWLTLSALGGAYMASIPFAVRSFRRLKCQADATTATQDTP